MPDCRRVLPGARCAIGLFPGLHHHGHDPVGAPDRDRHLALAALTAHMSGTPLARAIPQMIRDEGPMALDRYMALCLGHPEHGYYMARDPFGETGDFITAPETSQIFGELIGVWCISVYRALAAPPRVNLIELGPGRGRLMRDVIRAARVAPDFGHAVEIHLVETSPALRKAQADAVPGATAWHSRLDTVPKGPLILI